MKKQIIVKKLKNIEQIIAGDKCFLQEIFHPLRDDVQTNHSLAYAFVNPNGRTIDHKLTQTETYYILSGHGIMHINDETFEVEPGDAYVVPSNAHQWIVNSSDQKLEFLVIVDPPWSNDDEQVFE